MVRMRGWSAPREAAARHAAGALIGVELRRYAARDERERDLGEMLDPLYVCVCVASGAAEAAPRATESVCVFVVDRVGWPL